MNCLTSPSTAVSTPSRSLIFFLAATCGLIVANIYYAQPLAGPISAELGLPAATAGLVVTLTQIGYGAGLLLLVPLGDLIENRKLVIALTVACAVSLAIAACAQHPAPFYIASLLIGVSSVAVQILVPYASHLAPPETRGRVVGSIMSGLMCGIMLARPAASFITEFSSWQTVFWISSALMLTLTIALRLILPPRVPETGMHYGQLLASMLHLARKTPVLQRRSLYHACLFGAFSLFWTATPLLLAGPDFQLSQAGIAWFALAGVSGAVAAPIAGRIADRGWTRPATGIAMGAVAAAFLITHIGHPGSAFALGALVVAAIVLDFGVTANLVLGQRALFVLAAQHRSRLNGLYMATFFAGGAIGSALAGWSYAQSGWALTSWIGFALPVTAFLYYLSE
jgi:predicted MFS family arabinose efflux permease